MSRRYTSILKERHLKPIIEQKSLKTKVFVLKGDEYLGRDLYVTQISCSKSDARQLQEKFDRARVIQHINIIEYLETHVEEDKSGENSQFVYAVCECLPRSLLSECESRYNYDFFPENKLRRYLLCVVSACAYLQSQGIALRNICPENMRLDGQGVLKLADFKVKIELAGTLNGLIYVCPQQRTALIANRLEDYYDMFKSDVYSLGVVMLHLSLLEVPALYNLRILDNRINGYLQELQGRYSELWINTLRLLLTVDAEYRPDFAQLHKILFGPHFFPPSRSCDLIFLVDESGSTEGEVMCLMKSILRYIYELLSAESRIALIGFTDEARVHCELTQNRKEVIEKIERLESCDETNLEVGLAAAMDLIRRRETLSFRTFLLLLTDNEHEKTPPESIKPLLSIEECDRLTVHFFEIRGQIASKRLREMAGTQYSHSVVDYENMSAVVYREFGEFLTRN